MIVARHEVPGTASLERTSHRVRYDRAQLIPEVFPVERRAVFLKGRLKTLLVEEGYQRGSRTRRTPGSLAFWRRYSA
jgi:hypothetical protein